MSALPWATASSPRSRQSNTGLKVDWGYTWAQRWPMYSPKDVKKFWERVTPLSKDECWVWLNGRCKGRGKFYCGGKLLPAYRVAWEIHHNQRFPEGLIPMHICNNGSCVNPHHIVPGTYSDNTRMAVADGIHPMGQRHHNGAKTHCKHGHEYTPENSLVWYPESGRKQCLECACKRLSLNGARLLRKRQERMLK